MSPVPVFNLKYKCLMWFAIASVSFRHFYPYRHRWRQSGISPLMPSYASGHMMHLSSFLLRLTPANQSRPHLIFCCLILPFSANVTLSALPTPPPPLALTPNFEVFPLKIPVSFYILFFCFFVFLLWQVREGGAVSRLRKHAHIHCKKRLYIFPSPAGMSPTKLSLAGNN